jgi:glycosyltransferase involved in cell wall biosynthesis
VRRFTVVGSSMRFTSGISFCTTRLTNALARRHHASAVLMRQLVPARFYPGRARVGAKLTDLDYAAGVDVYDGVDWYWGPTLIGAIRALRRQRPDAVIFHWWTGAVAHTYLVLAFVARRLGARVIFELHEIQDTGEAKLPLASQYVGLLWRLLNPLVDAFVVHSEFDRPVVGERFRTGDRPVEVIPTGSYDHFGDLGALTPAREAPEGVCNLLFFGTIRPYKGLEHLVEAFNSLSADEASRYWLTIVGETWEGWTLPAELVAASPHRDRITFVNDYVTDAEVARYFAGADVVVLPYLRSSSSGPLHVAMSAGLPVVVTGVGGLKEHAEEYGGAVFVSPGDPEAIVAAIARAERLRSERFADPHSWERVAERFNEVVDRLDRPVAGATRDDR